MNSNQKFEVLLIGPPGCGKSTLARELENDLKRLGVKRVLSQQRALPEGEYELEWKTHE